jgi:hypothetical protein
MADGRAAMSEAVRGGGGGGRKRRDHRGTRWRAESSCRPALRSVAVVHHVAAHPCCSASHHHQQALVSVGVGGESAPRPPSGARGAARRRCRPVELAAACRLAVPNMHHITAERIRQCDLACCQPLPCRRSRADASGTWQPTRKARKSSFTEKVARLSEWRCNDGASSRKVALLLRNHSSTLRRQQPNPHTYRTPCGVPGRRSRAHRNMKGSMERPNRPSTRHNTYGYARLRRSAVRSRTSRSLTESRLRAAPPRHPQRGAAGGPPSPTALGLR